MPHNPKLEVYQIWLKPLKGSGNTFREFITASYPKIGYSEESENSEIFIDFFKKFIEDIDTNAFIKDNNLKKAFTAYDTQPIPDREVSISPHSELFVIEGTIEGGKYGIKRNKSSIDNKQEKEGVEINDIILDKFYFSLYCPLNSGLGILMVQAYSTDSISDIFKDFVERLFSLEGKYRKAHVDKFIPKKFIDEFKEGSIIKGFTYTRKELITHMSNEPIENTNDEFTISIRITSKNGLDQHTLPFWRRILGKKEFNNKELNEFSKARAILKDPETEKEATFDITSDLEIKPIIYLKGRVDIGEDGIPNFTQLKKYCLHLLTEVIIPEITPGNAVIER